MKTAFRIAAGFLLAFLIGAFIGGEMQIYHQAQKSERTERLLPKGAINWGPNTMLWHVYVGGTFDSFTPLPWRQRVHIIVDTTNKNPDVHLKFENYDDTTVIRIGLP